MVALERAVSTALTSGRVTGFPTTEDDLRTIQRVHELGSDALAGAAPSADLLPLARRCIYLLVHGQPPPG